MRTLRSENSLDLRFGEKLLSYTCKRIEQLSKGDMRLINEWIKQLVLLVVQEEAESYDVTFEHVSALFEQI